MRVTLVIDGLGPGGAQRVLVMMANYWVAKGWPVTMVTLAGADAPRAFALDPGVALVPLGTARLERGPLARLLGKGQHIRALRRAIVASRSEVVVSFLDKVNVLTLLATRGLPIPVVVAERIDPAAYSIGKLWGGLRAWTYPMAAALVAQSTSALSFFPHAPGRAERVIPNPVASGRSEHERPRRGAEGYLVLGLGRLGPQKGFDRLLEAFAMVASQFPEWRLEIWGEGAERAALERQRNELGLADRVRFPGVTAAPTEVLRSADLFVLSSRFEGFPNSLCEAMACGLPVISYDCPSGPREIIRDGIDGLLVPPEGGTEALSRALAQLMGDSDGRRRLAARAPEVLERFGIEKVMPLWEKLLEELNHERTAP